jgi:signal transduction histidine kinase
MGTRSPGEPDAVEARVASLLEEKLRIAVHEIRQPLAAVLALAEVARTLPDVPADARDYLDQLIDQAQEVSAAAWSVLEPRASADTSAVDVDELLDSVCRGFRATWTGTLERRGENGLVARGSRAKVRRCLVNVLENAVRAAGPDGRVVVTARRGAEWVRIVIEDDGPGFGRIPRGAGLGLSVTREALESAGGALSIGGAQSGGTHSRTRGGVHVVLTLPVPIDGPGYADDSVRAG